MMNKVVRTGCISGLADEIGRLKKKSDRLYEELIELTDVRNKVQLEINLLQDAVNRVCDTEEDV